ncbi:MAG: hypothetical protein GY733_10370 [bacterium]|nr:hypothetical protein [bacterium]
MKLSSLGRLLRTVRHYRPVQLVAQVKHLMTEEGRPGPAGGDVPQLAAQHVPAAFLPAPAHAKFDGERGFELISRAYRFEDAIDWNHEALGPLWAFHLNQFDWARDPSIDPAVRTRVIEDWIDHCERGAGWAPHPISLRILSWGKLLLTPGALELRENQSMRVRASLAQQAEALSRRIEVRLQANHLFSNLLGVVFAGLMFEGSHANRWLGFERALRREIQVQIRPDGSHIERSPMYHALLLENVLDLLNLTRAVPGRAPAVLVSQLEAAAARMLGAHRVWTHPDGEIALLGDAAFDIAHAPSRLEAYGDALGVAARGPAHAGRLADAGVFRLESGDFAVIVSAASPAPSYQPGHAHCDALSFELSVADQRVVTDSGVSEYIPGALRDASRTTASHATLEVDGEEQSEIWSAHRIGGRARVDVECAEADRLVASCVTWSRPRAAHRRSFCARAGCLEIEDRIEATALPVRLFLPFAPDLATPSLDPNAGILEVDLRSGQRLRVELPKGVAWTLEPSLYLPRFGDQRERHTLVGRNDNFTHGTWRFSLVRP